MFNSSWDEGVGSGPNAEGYGDMPYSMVDEVRPAAVIAAADACRSLGCLWHFLWHCHTAVGAWASMPHGRVPLWAGVETILSRAGPR